MKKTVECLLFLALTLTLSTDSNAQYKWVSSQEPPKMKKDAESLDAYVGHYVVEIERRDYPVDSLFISKVGNKLILQVKRGGPRGLGTIELLRRSRDEYSAQINPSYYITFIRDANGHVFAYRWTVESKQNGKWVADRR